MNTTPPSLPPDTSDEGKKVYNLFADKIGGAPNLRLKDNLYQAVAIIVCVCIGGSIGWVRGGSPGAVVAGVAAGLVIGLLLSGFVLAIIGLVRKL